MSRGIEPCLCGGCNNCQRALGSIDYAPLCEDCGDPCNRTDIDGRCDDCARKHAIADDAFLDLDLLPVLRGAA